MMDLINIYILNDENILIDEIMKLDVLLSGEKKRRIENAIQIDTKKKIICSTLLSYYAFRCHNIKKEIAVKVFSISDYLLNISNTYHSNAHSNKIYIQVISKESIAVDIEKYVDRSRSVYALMKTKTKLKFYYRWLKKECAIKIGDSVKKLFYVFLIDGYICGIMSDNQNIKINTVTFESILKQLKQDKLIF